MSRISLDIAHKILATFGITKPSRQYERWVKPYGFDVKDFDSVLFESEYIFIIDWRACLREEIERVAATLQKLGVSLHYNFNEDGDAGVIKCGERTAKIKYRPNDDDDLNVVIRSIQSVIPVTLEFRASKFNQGSDTLVFAILPKDEWADLENCANETIAYFFCPMPK